MVTKATTHRKYNLQNNIYTRISAPAQGESPCPPRLKFMQEKCKQSQLVCFCPPNSKKYGNYEDANQIVWLTNANRVLPKATVTVIHSCIKKKIKLAHELFKKKAAIWCKAFLFSDLIVVSQSPLIHWHRLPRRIARKVRCALYAR